MLDSGTHEDYSAAGRHALEDHAVYYAEINQRTTSRLGGIHSAMLLLKSLNYADVAAAVQSDDTSALSSFLCQGANELKAAGAGALVLWANIAHKAAHSVEAEVKMPVLHFADFTAREVLNRGCRRIGLFGSQAVTEHDFYRQRWETFGLDVCVPMDAAFRAAADESIFHETSQDVIPERTQETWHEACRSLVDEQKVDCLVLACTELRLVLQGVILACLSSRRRCCMPKVLLTGRWM